MRSDRLAFRVTLYLGEALEADRLVAGLTREQVIARMPEPIHHQTLATYEKGTRSMTMERYLEICAGLGVSAPDMLLHAMVRAGAVDGEAIRDRSRRLATELRAIADELVESRSTDG